MDYSVKNDYGEISIKEHVFLEIGRRVVKRHRCVVEAKNLKESYFRRVDGLNENIAALFLEKNNVELSVHLNIIVKFGQSLSKLSNEIIEETKKEIYEETGVEIDKVIVHIKGLKMKKIVKRNIKYEG